MSRGFVVCALAVVATRCLVWRYVPPTCEDSYITFRYALNLVEGAGLVYNPGEWVMGFTSLPWTLWCAAGLWLNAPPEGWSRATSIACDLATLAMMMRFLPRPQSLCFGVLFALLSPFAGISMSGMESSAFLCSVVAAATTRRWWLVALSAMIRPEGVLVAGVMSLWLSWRGRLLLASSLATFFGVIWTLYGSPIPNSVVAKASTYGVHPFVSIAWVEWVLPTWSSALAVTTEGRWLAYLSVLTLPAALVGAWWAWRGPVRPVVASLGVVWLAYIVTGTTYFSWYLTVPLAAFAVLISLGLPQILRGRVVWACLVATLALTWPGTAAIYQARSRIETRDFLGAGVHLKKNAERGQSILLEPIGMIGWINRLRVIDEPGLVSPAVIRERRLGRGWYGRIVRSEAPDWVLFRKSFADSGTLYGGGGGAFLDRKDAETSLAPYRVVAAFGPDGPNQMILLQRRSPP